VWVMPPYGPPPIYKEQFGLGVDHQTLKESIVSYQLSISGHRDLPAEQTEAFERAQLAEARKCVAALEGVVAATFSGGSIGFVDLTKPE